MNKLILLILLLFSTTGYAGIFNIFKTEYSKGEEFYAAGDYTAAYEHYIKAAKQNNTDLIRQSIYTRLANMNFIGRGTSKNIEKAIEYYYEAINGDDQTYRCYGKLDLAKIYTSEHGFKNAEKAIKHLQEVANTCPIDARWLANSALGLLYFDGIPGQLESDRVKALSYYIASDLEGNTGAKDMIELLLDYPDAYMHHNKDEFLSRPTGMAPGGMETAYKLFTLNDYVAALNIFKWQALNGNAEAQYEMANYHKVGLSVQQDLKKSAAWFYLSAKHGNPKAQLELGRMTRSGAVAGGDKEAVKWLAMSGAQGYGDAYNTLAEIAINPINEEGKKDTPNPIQAFEYSKKAADLGSPMGYTNLGHCYLLGIGVIKNRTLAYEYFKKAAGLGEASAKAVLATEFSQSYTKNSIEPNAPTKVAGQKADGNTPVAPPLEREINNSPSQVAAKQEMSPVELYSKYASSVFKIVATDDTKVSQGSAVAIAATKLVTNNHVVKKRPLAGFLYQGKVILAKPTNRSESKDLNILETIETLPFINIMRSYESVRVGERVYAIGSPEGLDNTLSEGIVSAKRIINGVRHIQTTADITHGSSGGALFDAQGRLIGITTFGVGDKGSLNFAVSIDELEGLI